MKKKTIICIICLIAIILIAVIYGIFSKKTKLEDEYLQIFENRKFVINGKKKTLKDILGEDGNIDYYSFVDYGNDSHIEMFVRLSNKNRYSYVFNLQGKTMYGYLLDESVVSNSYNGYSSFIGDYTGWVKYTFNKNKISKEKIIYKNYDENKCEYKEAKINCKEMEEKELEFLNSIDKIVDNLTYGEES